MAQPHVPGTERRDGLFAWDQDGSRPERRARVSTRQRQDRGSVTPLGLVSEGRPRGFSGERRAEPDRNLLRALGSAGAAGAEAGRAQRAASCAGRRGRPASWGRLQQYFRAQPFLKDLNFLHNDSM